MDYTRAIHAFVLLLNAAWLVECAGNTDDCIAYCKGNTIEDVYCWTYATVKLRVLNETPFTANFFPHPPTQGYRYEVEILEQYKGGELPTLMETAVVSPSLCGLRYVPGRTYLMMTGIKSTDLPEHWLKGVIYGTNCNQLNIDVEAEPEALAEAMQVINNPPC